MIQSINNFRYHLLHGTLPLFHDLSYSIPQRKEKSVSEERKNDGLVIEKNEKSSCHRRSSVDVAWNGSDAKNKQEVRIKSRRRTVTSG